MSALPPKADIGTIPAESARSPGPRPSASAAVEKRIQDRLRAGMGIIKVAREVGVGNLGPGVEVRAPPWDHDHPGVVPCSGLRPVASARFNVGALLLSRQPHGSGYLKRAE
jgi:hypothetical protein